MLLMYIRLFLFIGVFSDTSQGFDSSLVRTKRKPLSEYDYIEESKNEFTKDNEIPSPIRTQRHALDNSKITGTLFERLIQKTKLKKDRVDKRQTVGGLKNDPFLKLKAFFDELNKRSVVDADNESYEKKSMVRRDEDNGNANRVKLVSKKATMEDTQYDEDNRDMSKPSMQEEVKKTIVPITLKDTISKETVGKTGTVTEKDKDKEDEEVEESGSGITESGSGESGESSGESESGSGTSDETSKNVIKRSSSDNYDELFEAKLTTGNHMERNKREIDDGEEEGNPNFEGLPEHLATIRRENPRAKILKQEAKNKHIPDIPLPFNYVVQETDQDKRTVTVMKREIRQPMKRFAPVTPKQTVKIIPYKEFNSLNVIKRALTEDEFKNLRIIDEEKAKSLFDDDEGDFLRHVKKDGIYYDTRHKRFLISANADSINRAEINENKMKRKNGLTVKRQVNSVTIPQRVLHIKDTEDISHTESKVPIKEQVKNVRRNDIKNLADAGKEIKHNTTTSEATNNTNLHVSNNTINPYQETQINTNIEKVHKTGINETLSITNASSVDKKVLQASKMSSKKEIPELHRIENSTAIHNTSLHFEKQAKVVKRDITDDEEDTVRQLRLIIHHQKPRKGYLKLRKRAILSDDDPDTDELMRTEGKEAVIVRHGRNMKTAEKVYKFARNVMNLVDSGQNEKGKRNFENNPLTGVWSGLGTSPEFVPGLIKRDYDDNVHGGNKQTNIKRKITKTKGFHSNQQKRKVAKRHVQENDKNYPHSKTIRKEVNAVQTKQTPLKRSLEKDGIWTDAHGFPVFKRIHNKAIPKLKRDVDKEEDEDDVKTPTKDNEEELPLLSKRDTIPSDFDDDESDEPDDNKKNKEKDFKIEKREIKEQMELKHMELGSLGSINMMPLQAAKAKRNAIHNKKTTERRKTKRSDIELEKEITHTETTPVQDGNVVFAFDEVKELLPTKRFFSQDEEQILEPVNNLQTGVPRASVIDIDKELADSMILAGEKRSNIYPNGLTATKIEYQANDDDKLGSERSKLHQSPPLLQKNNQLKKGQLAAVKNDETQHKYDQMKYWVQNNKDKEEIETERKIQEVSDQLAESNSELEKLKTAKQTETDSAYLAKKLEEKNSIAADSTKNREEQFEKLQQQILDEQETYRKLIAEQRRIYEEKIEAEQQVLSKNKTGILNNTMKGKETHVQTSKHVDAFQNGTTTPSSKETNLTTPETAGVGQSSERLIDGLNRMMGDIHNETLATPQTWEHLDRVHNVHNDSGETFPEANNPEELQNNETSTTPPPNTDTTSLVVQTTTIDPKVTATAGTNTTMTITTTIAPVINTTLSSISTTLSSSAPRPTTTSTTATSQPTPKIESFTVKPLPLTNSTTTTPLLPSTTIALTTIISSTTVEVTKTNSSSTTLPTSALPTTTTTVTATLPPQTPVPVMHAVTAPPLKKNDSNLSFNTSSPTKSIISSTVDSQSGNFLPNLTETTKPPLESTEIQHRYVSVERLNHEHDEAHENKAENTTNIVNENIPTSSSRENNNSEVDKLTKSQEESAVIQTQHGNENMAKSSNEHNNAEVYNSHALVGDTSNEETLLPTKVKLPFPLEIAYRPRPVSSKNKKNKKLEIEPRADGYIGCFIDHLVQGRDLPVRAGIPFVTPTNCRTACKKTGYKYAGLQYGYLCFCGNNYGKYDIVPDSECNTVCAGNDTFSCGGLWRNEVFDTEHVIGTYEGNVPFIMPPKIRTSMTEQPGMVRSIIPSGPNMVTANGKSETNEELLKEVQDSEQADIKALENEKQDAIGRSNVDVVRKVGNFTDEDLINAAKLEMALDHATLSDARAVNHGPDVNPVPSSMTETSNSDDKGEKVVATFVYLHPQNENDEEPKHSPVVPMKIEPGTHLFRGEVMLQQPWYDDLSKPDSIKYNILAGNVEEALKNVFVNDTSFLKAEVLSLREDGQRSPHKTVVDFTMTFKQNETTDTVTRKLFDSVLDTKHLDEMPVSPKSLKVKEYLHDSNAQAYIPQVVDGKLHLDTSSPIELQYNSENKLVIPANTESQQHLSPSPSEISSVIQSVPFGSNMQPTLGLSSMLPLPAVDTAPQLLSQANTAPLNPALRTHIRPVSTNGMAELKNYMQSQTIDVNAALRGIINKPDLKQSVGSSPQKQQGEPVKKRKVPYVLRMFFWKDMLARKKRENNMNELTKFKAEAKKRKVIDFGNSVPVIRTRREQADEWPVVYKKDDQKQGYHKKSFIKRKKRVLLDKNIFENDTADISKDETDLQFESLFSNIKSHTKRSSEHTKKELVSDSLLKNIRNTNTANENILRRSKRYDFDDEDK